jgi:sulfite exporter TauE/SafE
MMILLVTVFSASLLGSLHCAGMCGPFCCVAVCAVRKERPAPLLYVAYHGGRLITYCLMGAAAGTLGALLNLASTLAGLQPVALALAGGILVLCGIAELAKISGWKVPGMTRLNLPAGWLRLMQMGQKFAGKRSAFPKALIIGLLTTLLPCGWLYAFVVTAAGSGGPVHGMAVMVAFWLGTLPVLLSLGVTAKRLSGVLGERLPLATALALIAVGLLTLSGRISLSPEAIAKEVTKDATEQVKNVPDPETLPPCCRPQAEENSGR